MPSPSEIMRSLDKLIAQRNNLVMATTATINMADKSLRNAKSKRVEVLLYLKKLESRLAVQEAKELIALYDKTGSLVYKR